MLVPTDGLAPAGPPQTGHPMVEAGAADLVEVTVAAGLVADQAEARGVAEVAGSERAADLVDLAGLADWEDWAAAAESQTLQQVSSPVIAQFSSKSIQRSSSAK